MGLNEPQQYIYFKGVPTFLLCEKRIQAQCFLYGSTRWIWYM